jgi:hypothetical protein
MEARIYRVGIVEQSSGDVAYSLDGPGLKAERVYRGEETRERLEEVVKLMNFAFEQGQQALTAELRETTRLGTSVGQHDRNLVPPAPKGVQRDES